MNQYKKWLMTAVLAVLAALILEAAIVVYVDPFFQYHAPLEDFPYLVDNQINQNPGMATHMEYDSVILGSSMTVNFNTGWFQEVLGLNTIKLNYSGAYPKDQANIMERIFHSDNQIKTVFLGLDVMTCTGGVEETKYPIPDYLYDDVIWDDAAYLWNKDVFLNYILRPMADPDKTDLATVYQSWWTDEYYNIQWVMHNYENPDQVQEETAKEAYLASVEANLAQNIGPYIEQNQDTVFYVFFPPYSILYWNDVMKENHLEATMAEYQYIADRLLGYDNVRVFYFPDREEIVTDLNNYADYTHYHRDINRYMTECFGDGTCEILSSEEMSEALARTREMIERFDFEELFSVEW